MFDIFYFHNPSNLFSFEQKVDTVEQAQELSRTRYLWIVDGLNDYSNFNFLWEPSPWEADQTHVWPSQHQENGGTYLLPKKMSKEYNRDHPMVPRKNSVPRLHIKNSPNSPDFGDLNTRYISDYLGTMRRALSKTDWQYCWVTSDVCDYSEFDFTWHSSEWQQDMLHVFASNEQKFGDTFYVHVPSFLEKTKNLKVLEWFETLHFVEDVSVLRPGPEYVKYESDSVVSAVWNHEFSSPLTVFYRYDMVWAPTVSLWQERTKTVVPLIEGSETVLVPRECKNYLKKQIYDYPYVNKNYQSILKSRNCSDVIFISNGESMAEKHWNILIDICPRALRCDGIDGRDKAYKAAASMSNTDWFFAVFAKTEVLPSFGFDFQPDRLQEAKHYIFYSRNALNGLEYGSMNIDLYNKQLVLDTHIEDGSMLDFTLSKLHTVVPVVASIAQFNTDPWVTWRSAFREVIKLQQEVDNGAGPEIQFRLKTWCEKAEGDNAEYCLAGANDALEFYHSVNADPKELQKSFHWDWIKQWYYNKYQREIWLESI
jgi:hypothetical protein